MKRKDLNLVGEQIGQIAQRIGWLSSQKHFPALFWDQQTSRAVWIPEFSLADAIQTIADHLGMEFQVNEKRVVLIKKKVGK